MRNLSLMLCAFALTVACGDDGGTTDTDSGVRTDASTMTDASTSEDDASTTEDDASTSEDDAGMMDDDAGMMADAGSDAGGDAVSFAADVWPILMAKCAGCHVGAGSMGALALGVSAATAHAALVGVPHTRGGGCSPALRVAAGDPEMSLLMLKVEDRQAAACGDRMPDPPRMMLTAPEIETIRAWIAAGALND